MGGSLKSIKSYREDLVYRDGLRIVEDLRTHPNYKETEPQEGESIIAFTLRCAAHLVSPPMLDDEDNEFECTEISEQILALEKAITKRWENS